MRTFTDLLLHRIARALPLRPMRVRRRRAALRRAESLPAHGRRLFVDVSVISTHDAGTGIQRVVRGLAVALAAAPGAWDVRFVSGGRRRRYRRIAWPDAAGRPVGEEMAARPGDVFLGLDYALDAVRWQRGQLRRFRRAGGRLWFLVHDLLPLDLPGWFSANTVIRYRAWLDILAGVADGFLCNSPHTHDELARALAREYGLECGYEARVLPMGHVVFDGEPVPLRFDASAPFALMVGTLEPRKGHADVVNAFTRLWEEGRTERLVLVGRLGWHVDALRDLVRTHPEHGRRLLWFADMGDAELSGVYEASLGVIVASYGEGFGLPLIEALGYGRPVLARDLPVFRPHEERGVRFFPANADARALAGVIGRWLDDVAAGAVAVTRPTVDWDASARALLAALDDAPNGSDAAR